MARFLLVDDNPDDRALVIWHLREVFDDVETLEAVSQEQLEEALEQETFDAVITDYRLHWTDGIQVLKAVKNRLPDCPVVMFTGTGDQMIAVQAMKSGLDDYVLKNSSGYPHLAEAVKRAIESAWQRQALRETERRYHRLFESIPLGLFRMTREGVFLDVNASMVRTLRYPSREILLRQNVWELCAGPKESAECPWPTQEGEALTLVTQIRCYDRCYIWADINVRLVRDEKAGLLLEGSLQDVTERQEYTRHLAALARITRVALQQDTSENVLRAIGEELRDLFRADSCYLTHWDESAGKVSPVVSIGHAEETYPHMEAVAAENTLTHTALQRGEVVTVENVFESSVLRRDIAEKFPVRAVIALPLKAYGHAMGAALVGFHHPRQFTEAEIRRAEDLAAHISLVLTTSALLQETQQRVAELESVRQAALQLTSSLDRQTVFDTILRQIHDLLEVFNTHIFLYENGRLRFAAGVYHGRNLAHPIAEPRRDGITARVAHTGEAIVIENAGSHPLFHNYEMEFNGAIAAFPMKIGGRVVGVLNVAYETARQFQAHEIRILELLADQAAIAVQNASLYESVQRGYQRLQSLRTIDNAITASMDLNITLGVFLDQVMRQLGTDATAIALYDSATTTLRYAMTRGLPQNVFPRGDIRLGLTLSGKVALRKEMLIMEEFSPVQNHMDANIMPRLPAMYIGMPLVAKGELQGVLEIYQYEAFPPEAEWLDFAASLATQAAIAIENFRLFDRLQRFNFELEMAYDQTLEGWARALELRGAEPEGHALRVVELTTAFARSVIQDEKRLLDIRRGALLHDIGKVAVPDAILLKPGPLDEEEWRIMRQHPVYARQLLEPIHFLRNALEIPYAHHEHWDGSGYPRGLKGERIPLSARLFAIVDVWDALTAERPYRPAWPPEKAMQYLEEQAGRLFDPSLVSPFLDLLQTGFFDLE